MLRWLAFGWVVFNVTSELINAFGHLEPPTISGELPPCRACKIFVESFNNGLERTAKFKFEGGDTAWEEEKLGRYATSEIRFVEIQEKLCFEIRDGRDSCYNLIEEYEETLEDWWFNRQARDPDLFKYLCIDTFEVCCGDLHYGRDCLPCPGYPGNVCHNNGKCKGAGTRKGDGKCFCERGYAGDYCNQCASTFYLSYKDDKKVLCSECHWACEGFCSKAGPAGCDKCKPGWVMDKEKGCLDINECAATKSPCTPLQFCVNKEGGYRCLDCDRACAGCTGDGPDMCIHCASGFYKKDNMCTDASEEYRKSYVVFARYLTYIGLCITTCIILHKNTYLAAIIGSCVAIYITVSEYMLHSSPKSNDLENQVAEQVLRAFN